MEERAVDAAEARKFCEQNGMLYNEASAKTGENVLTLFSGLANKIYVDILQDRQ